MPPAPDSPPSRIVTTERGEVEFVDAGDGPPVLVVHGSPGGYDAGWLMAQFLLAAGFRVVVPSRPGYLGTPLTEATAPIDAQADLHAALLAQLGIDRAGVMCWSGGGPSSYRFAVRHPDLVESLVALAAVSRRYVWDLGADEKFMFGTRPGNWLITVLARHRPRQLITATLASEGSLSKDQVSELADQVFEDPVQRDFVLRLAETVSHRGDRRAGVENDQTTFAAIDSLELSAIRAPVLLVQGAADSDVTPDYSDFAHEQIPDSRLVTVPEGTHLAAFTAPGSTGVQEQIAAFLRNRG